MELGELVINNGVGVAFGLYAMYLLNVTVKENTKAIQKLIEYIKK